MLRLNKGELGTRQKTWYITCCDLRKKGIRRAQGFSLEFDFTGEVGHHYWTTDEFTAYLFHKRFRWSDKEVTAEFASTIKREKYLYKLSSATNAEINLASPVGFQYRDYQKAGIEYCLNVRNVLLADQQRVGKTATAIGTLNNLENVQKVVIACPKTAKSVWVHELSQWLIDPLKIQVLNAQSEVDPEANIYIVNYDVVYMLRDLQDIDFDVIIGDEIHFCKDMDARRARFFYSLKGKKKLGLSGTPLLNSPEDLLTVVKWLDPRWNQFRIVRDRYVSPKGITLSLEEGQELLRSTIMIRRVQAQVFDSEPIERRIVPLETPAELEPLVQIELEGYKQLKVLPEYSQARRVLGLHKVNYAINHIQTYTSDGEKMVVFAHHKAVVDRIASSLGKRAMVVYGDTTDSERKLARDRFQTDPTCSVIVGSIKAMGSAIPLSAASHILFVESDWSAGDMGQAEERCSDKNQKNQIIIEMLAFEGSLDFYMFHNVDNKNIISSRGIDI